MKALIDYELRRLFTCRMLACVVLFTLAFAVLHLIAGGSMAPLESRLLDKAYNQSQMVFMSAFLINYGIVGLSMYTALSLFNRGTEDIAVFMRRKKSAVFLTRMIIGHAFMMFMVLQLTMIVCLFFALLEIDSVTFLNLLGESLPVAAYFFAFMSVFGVYIKSPRAMLVLFPLVFAVDTFTPQNDRSLTPLSAIASKVFPMIRIQVDQGVFPATSWATLFLTGLFYVIVFGMFMEKSH
ncbi:MAG: hypothetical protein ACQEQA_03225 [Bacillota bacterium]